MENLFEKKSIVSENKMNKMLELTGMNFEVVIMPILSKVKQNVFN